MFLAMRGARFMSDSRRFCDGTAASHGNVNFLDRSAAPGVDVDVAWAKKFQLLRKIKFWACLGGFLDFAVVPVPG
jgi:hypothetical protein